MKNEKQEKEDFTLPSYTKLLFKAAQARNSFPQITYFDHGFDLRKSYEEWSPTTAYNLSDDDQMQLLLGRNDVADGKLSLRDYQKFFVEKTGSELGPHKTTILTRFPETLSEPSSYIVARQNLQDYRGMLLTLEDIMLQPIGVARPNYEKPLPESFPSSKQVSYSRR